MSDTKTLEDRYQEKIIGYVVTSSRAGVPGWKDEPMAMTVSPGLDPTRRLLRRSCFTQFETEAEAEAAIKSLWGFDWVKGTTFRIIPVVVEA